MMDRLRQNAASLLRSKSGNFGIITAFLLLPVMGAVGLAVDVAQMGTARSQLQDDLDSATLSGANTLTKGTTAQATTMVTQSFRGLASQHKGYAAGDVSVSIDTTNNIVSASVKAKLPTTFMRVFGVKTMEVAVASKAKSGQDKYYEISLVLDKSASMLLAATTADQSVMQKLSLNCVFACHDTQYAETYQGVYYNSYYAYARAKGVTLRADVQAQAVTALMDTIDEVDPKHTHVKIEIYSLGSASSAANVLKSSYNVANGIRRVVSLTNDTGTIRTQMTTNKELTSDTSYITTDYRALTTLNNYITAAGDGSSSSKPLKAVILITDGVQSSADWVFSGQPNITPLNPTWCDKVKNLQANFSVLYTTYLPWTNRSEYNNSVGNTMGTSYFKSTWGGTMPSPATTTRHDYIPTALASCASSPEYFLSAASPTDIKAGLKTLVGRSLEGLRLTQ